LNIVLPFMKSKKIAASILRSIDFTNHGLQSPRIMFQLAIRSTFAILLLLHELTDHGLRSPRIMFQLVLTHSSFHILEHE
jgi:hypothetical protein